MQNPIQLTARQTARLHSAWQVLFRPRTLLVVALLLALLHVPLLTVYPALFIDESWGMSRAWVTVTSGVHYDVLHRDATSISRPTVPGTFALLTIGIAELWGLDFFWMRFVPWLAGMLLLLLTFHLGRRLYDPWVGALATFLLLFNDAFVLDGHLLRKEIFLAVLVVGAFILFSYGQESGRTWPHLLAGLCLGVGQTIHDNSIGFIAALGVLYLHEYGWRVFRSPAVWLGVLGGSFGLFHRLLFAILPDPAAYAQRAAYIYTAEHAIPVLTYDPLKMISRELLRYRSYFVIENRLLELALVGLGVGIGLWRRARADRWLLIIIFVPIVVFTLLVSNKDPRYLVNFFPFLSILAASALLTGLREVKGLPAARAVMVGVLLVFTLIPPLHHLSAAREALQAPSYDEAMTELEAVIPVGSRVLGKPTYWLGLHDRDYRGTHALTMLNFERNFTLQQSMEFIRPQYVIVDTHLRGQLVDQGYFSRTAGSDSLDLPRRDFEQFLARQGTLVLKHPYNQLEVYKIVW